MKSKGMRIAGGILALVASVGGTVAGLITVIFGAVGKTAGDYTVVHGGVSGEDWLKAGTMASQGEAVMLMGWAGILASFLALILGIVVLCSKRQLSAWILLACSLLGIVFGGTLVAVFMALSLLGAVFALVGGRPLKSNINQEII